MQTFLFSGGVPGQAPPCNLQPDASKDDSWPGRLGGKIQP